MADCLRMDVGGPDIDLERAIRQHDDYCRLLERCGATVRTLPASPDFPDCVFIEDTAVVLDEAAILCSMGHPARRGEPAGVAPELQHLRDAVHRIELPATIDGGDILRVGRRILAGLSSRTNAAAIEALAGIGRRYGYSVEAIPIGGCLHLKSACTALPDGRLLANPAWLKGALPEGFDIVPVPPDEPHPANVALVGETICAAAAYSSKVGMLREIGFRVETVDLSEFAKADGCVTCLSLLFDSP